MDFATFDDQRVPPSVWTFASWHPRPWPSKGLEHGPRRQKSGCNFWDGLQWHVMTIMRYDFWQCKHEFNIIMSKRNGRTTDDVAWVCSVDFHGEKPLHAHPLSKHIWTCGTIVNTIKKPKIHEYDNMHMGLYYAHSSFFSFGYAHSFSLQYTCVSW